MENGGGWVCSGGLEGFYIYKSITKNSLKKSHFMLDRLRDMVYNVYRKTKGDVTMTFAEMFARIDELKKQIFLVNMADFLTAEDRAYLRKWENEIAMLNKIIADAEPR